MAPLTLLTRGSPPEEPGVPPPPASNSSSVSSNTSITQSEMTTEEINSNNQPLNDSQTSSIDSPPETSLASTNLSPNVDHSLNADQNSELVISPEFVSLEENNDAKFPNESLDRLDEMLSRARWIVPVLPEQELQTLLRASIALCTKELDEENEFCQKFMRESLIVCFTRLMADDAVKEWKQEIQKYIFDCAMLFVELCVLKLLDDTSHLLDLLALVFNPRNKYHSHNCHKSVESQRVETSSIALDDEEPEGMYARSPNIGAPKGWLVLLINHFGHSGGFQKIVERFLTEKTVNCATICTLIKPFGLCYLYLTPHTVQTYFTDILEKASKYMHNITDEELKKETKGDARDNSPIEVVRYMRNLAARVSGQENIVRDLERLRLKTILRTLQMSSFAGKMNALNEISRVLSPNMSTQEEVLLTTVEVVNWMRDNDLLGVAIKENLHILQYVEKLERILRFMIKEKALTTRDLDQIWAAQTGKHDAIVKNVHDLLTKLAWDFTGEQLDHLFGCFQDSWREANKKQREKLLELIRRLAEDDKEGQMADKVLKLLWNLARDNDITTDIMDQALQCHAKILEYNLSAQKERERVKLMWLEKCIEEIRRDVWILPALKHFRDICQQYSEPPANSSFPQWPSVTYRNNVVNQLQSEYSLVAVVSASLGKYIERVRTFLAANPSTDVTPSTLMLDHRYDHNAQVYKRLSFLKFLLRDGQLWLCEVQAKQIWDCLIVSPVFPADRESGFKWFGKMMEDDADLDPQIWRNFFETKVLSLEPCMLSEAGMTCFERFFKHVNHNEGRLMMDNSQFPHVNNFDMIGQEYLWRVVMQSGEQIAERAIDLLREVYGNPSSEMMEKLNQLHTDFISSCLERLRASYDTLKVLTNEKDNKDNVNQIRQETTRMTRVLRVLHGYISSYDEQYNEERIHLPMYRACKGRTLSVTVQFQAQGGRPSESVDFVTHSNETLGGFRRLVLHEIRAQTGVRVELFYNSEILDRADDRKLLHEMCFANRTILQGKLQHGRSGNNGSSPDSSGESSADGSPQNEQMSRAEMEILLPSTWMCRKADVVEFLLSITELGMKLENEPLRDWARLVLRLIPCSTNMVAKITNSFKNKSLQSTPIVATSTTNAANPLQGVFFGQTASDVVYCLELVYCQLVPARELENDQTVAFQTNFIKSDGLEICLSMLLQNNFLAQADSFTKSIAFYWVLRLLKVLLNVTSHMKLAAFETILRRNAQLPAAVPPLNDVQAQMNVLQTFLLATVGIQQDTLWKNMCKVWAENVKDYPIKQSLELAHVKIVLKVAWAAAAGNFALYSSSNLDEIHNAFSLATSSVPEQELCREALEVLTFCFGLVPSLIEPMTKEKMFQMCIVDVMFCSIPVIRQVAFEQFYAIATKSYQYLPKIMHFFITLLFTVSYTKASENSHICREFFYLLRNLLNFAHTVPLHVSNVEPLLDKEISWLKEVREHALNSFESYQDDALLEGHLLVTKELVSFLEASKKYYIGSSPQGPGLVKELLEDFLLPSSRMYVEQQKSQTIQRSVTLMENISASSDVETKDSQPTNSAIPRSMTTTYSPSRCVPVCGSPQTVNAAYDLTVALCTLCVPNMQYAVQLLTEMFYNETYSTITEWDYAPPVNLRNTNMFVGLKNAGATCYMNSVLQQLFTIEPLRNSIVNADPDSFDMDDTDNDEQQTSSVVSNADAVNANAPTKTPEQIRKEYHIGVLRCVQLIFANLLGSQLQYYVPKKFWKHFKFVTGEPINLREQHDSLEFFNKVVDATDEALKALGQPEICSKIFGGTFADQKICKDCPHRYTREEPFNTLSLDVRNQNSLIDSLQEYVKGDLLESENAYFCEKCNKKVDAIKRLCIKKLPPVLAIQLKRFDFDWEREQAIKFQDLFTFPREINMKPYTVQGLAKLDGEEPTDSENSKRLENESTHYKLRGVVVHSGQANGGHYFSYILHKFPNGTSKWFKFDDGEVSECRLDDDEELKNQCFGGEYSTEVYDAYYRRMQKRPAKRWWNAYILFYERVETDETALTKTLQSMSLSTRLRQMPTRLENIVRRKNMKCVHERNQYTPEYFMFIRNLSVANVGYLRTSAGPLNNETDIEKLVLLSINIMSKFLFSTGFHAKRSLHAAMHEWSEIYMIGFRVSAACRIWFAQEILFKHPGRFMEYFFDSPTADVRHSFGKILMHLAHFSHSDPASSIKCISERLLKPNESLSDCVIRTILGMLTKDTPDYSRHLKEYFQTIYSYASIGLTEKKQLIAFDVPSLFMKLALDNGDGPSIRTNMGDLQRLYSVISLLIRCCDVSQQCKTSDESPVPPNQYAELQPPICVVQSDVVKYLYESSKYIKRLLEDPLHNEDTAKLLKFACWENWNFSQSLIDIIIQNIRLSYNELRPILELLLHILTLTDSWSEQRNILALKGSDTVEAIFKLIQVQPMHQARRCYQIFKALVALFDNSPAALKVLSENPDLKRIWNEASEWLNSELSKKSYQSQYHAFNQWSASYQSNDGGTGIGLSRTPSAKLTLTHVRRIAKDYCQLPPTPNEVPVADTTSTAETSTNVEMAKSSNVVVTGPGISSNSDPPPPEYSAS